MSQGKKGTYEVKDDSKQQPTCSKINPVTAVVYNSLSVNTQNSLEIIEKQNPGISILNRNQSIPFEVEELHKIEQAITLGFQETAKNTKSSPNNGVDSENSGIKIQTLFKKSETCNQAKFFRKNSTKLGKKDSKQNLCIEDLKNDFVIPIDDKKSKLEIVFDDHLIELNDFINRYETNITEGLDDEKVKFRLERDGKNVLKKKKSKPMIIRWLAEVFGGYNVIMWLAALLCFLCWQPLGGDNPSAYNLVLTIFLFVVIMVQSTISFIQQCRSDNLMASFEKFMPSKSSCLRNGKWSDVNSWELVVGDVVKVNIGEKIPADLRIVDCQQACIDKSCLTGESEPVRLSLTKIDSNPYETKNIAMFGSMVMEGSIVGIVFQTGDKTVMAKVASLALNAKGDITTMQREINYFALIIGSMSIGTGLLTFFIWLGAIKPNHPSFLSYSGIISACIGVVISFFPEGKILQLYVPYFFISNTQIEKLNCQF